MQFEATINKVFKSVFVVAMISVALIIPNSAMAECGGAACLKVKVTRLYLADHVGKVFVETNGNESLLTCAPFEDRFIILEPSQVFFKEMYATLLAAMLGEKGCNPFLLHYATR